MNNYVRKFNGQANCESCVFFDYNEFTERDECTMSLDEDELVKFVYTQSYVCPYYRFHDEYKTVQKQN